MAKEKQIEELKNILLEESNRFYGLECDEACAYCEASAVYDAGYRKESKNYIGTDEALRSIDYRPVEEVRKETAKEILKSFENRFSLYYPHGILTYDDIENQIISLAEKYGVEVEE